MKEQWVGKNEMLQLLDNVLSELDLVEETLATKLNRVSSSHRDTQVETLQLIELSIISVEKSVADLQKQSARNDWNCSNTGSLLRTV